MSDQLLAEARQFLDRAREQGADLDGSTNSVLFVQGVLESMARDADEEPSLRAVKCLAYSVYLAELLAEMCDDVRCVVDGEGMNLSEVLAVREGGPVQFVLSWVLGCLEDPSADNIIFKFAGALSDFGETEHASTMQKLFEDYRELSDL